MEYRVTELKDKIKVFAVIDPYDSIDEIEIFSNFEKAKSYILDIFEMCKNEYFSDDDEIESVKIGLEEAQNTTDFNSVAFDTPVPYINEYFVQ